MTYIIHPQVQVTDISCGGPDASHSQKSGDWVLNYWPFDHKNIIFFFFPTKVNAFVTDSGTEVTRLEWGSYLQ